MRYRRSLALCALAVPLASCISAPPAPLDATTAAHRLTERSLDDPPVADALKKAGFAADGEWNADALTVAAWTLRADVAVAAAEVAAGSAALRTAGELPNPTISLDPGYLTDNANNNVSPWSLAAAIGFTIETGDKRAIRKDQAQAELEVRRWQYAETLWKTRAEVRKALIARTVAAQTLALAEKEVRLRRAFSAWVENAFKFGAVAQPDRLNAAGNLAQAETALRTARGDMAADEAALAAAVGVTVAHFPVARLAAPSTATLPDPASTDATTLRETALINRLGVRHALADYAVAEQNLRMAVAKQYPDISFGPGYSYDKGDKGVTLALGFTLPVFHGERAAIDEAIVARQKAAASFDAEQSTALSEIETALARYGAAYSAWTEAKNAETAAAAAATAAEKRLTLGGADRGDTVAAELGKVAAERATLEALRASIDALGLLEDGVQRPIWPASALAPSSH